MIRNSKALPKIVLSTIKNLLADYYENISEDELEILFSEGKPELEKVWFTYSEVAQILLCTKRHVINLIEANNILPHYCGRRSPRLNREDIDNLIICRPRHPKNKNKDAS